MFKNKYVVWSLIGLWVLIVVAAGAWGLWKYRLSPADARTSLAAGQNDGSGTGASGPITINAGDQGGVPLNDGSSADSSTAANSDAVNKLLDPTTFGKYESYKDNQTASFADLNVGSGTAIADGSQVAVLYKGWLTNGKLFDQSRAGSDGKLQAFVFTEGQHQVIPGWEEGLAGAKPNGVRLLIVPPAAGYGAAGSGSIPGNSVLIFQVQVLQVR
jgi:FKBP-type peptidyl-prolyl cis-trans isomerase